MAVMQTSPNRYPQILMTAIGLVLLVMALVLNHKHPHNEGIATLPHNNIYGLNLSLKQSPTPVASFDFNNKPAIASHDINAQPAAAPHQAETASIVTASATTNINPPADNCPSLDQQAFATAAKNYNKAYKTYLRSKARLAQIYSLGDVAAADRQTAYYQAYLSALARAYSDYQLSVAATNCVPSQPAPTPMER